jgi:hypothetical protein
MTQSLIHTKTLTAMKPKILFCLALVLIGAILVAFCRSDNLRQWLLMRDQEKGAKNQDGLAFLLPNHLGTQTQATKLKIPWTDTKVILYRATGERVELDAKAAVYTVWSTRNGTNLGKGYDYSMGAFIDPETRFAWVGWAGCGNVDTQEFARSDSPSSIIYLTNTNFYIQTDSAIVSGDAVLSDGAFHWSGSLINQAQPGEKLEELINRCEQSAGASWPNGQRGWENNFRHYFRDQFFSSDNFGTQQTPIQNVSVASGKLRLDFDSMEYRTKGGVWLDLKTFQIRHAVEYRPVPFNLKMFCWGVVPALVAMMTGRVAWLLGRKAGSFAQRLLSGLVFMGVFWSLYMLFRIHVLGAWPTHLPLLKPVFAIGDWVIYFPAIAISVAAMITACQASFVRFEKQK